VQLDKRFRGLNLLTAQYTWSRLRDTLNLLNPQDGILEDRVSPNDRPHRFSAATTIGLPFGRNQKWGSGWGDEGYCYVPYRYVMDYNCRDSWIIKHVDVLDPDESTWADDDQSVLDALNTFLARMPEETYARMLDAMGEHLVEVRLALLFLRSASADGQLHDAELEAVAAHLQPVLEAARTGREDAASILAHARAYLDDGALVDETIRLFAEYFSADALAVMCSAMQQVAAADGDLAAAERAFVEGVASAWQVQAA